MTGPDEWRKLTIGEIIESVVIVASVLRDKLTEAEAKGEVLDERRMLARLLKVSIDLQKLVADRLQYNVMRVARRG